MNRQRTGGPVIPQLIVDEGLSLLDYFAAKALNGMLAHSRGKPPHGYRSANNREHWHDAIAKEAYLLGRAMLIQRQEIMEP